MKGEWILKEVYFQDGWPSVMRDPINKWVSLTDEEIHDAFQNSNRRSVYRVIESKLKDKNNG